MSENEKFNQSKYIRAYKNDHYERTEIQWPKDKNLKQRIKTAAATDGLSVNQWILKAIEKELEWYE